MLQFLYLNDVMAISAVITYYGESQRLDDFGGNHGMFHSETIFSPGPVDD